MDKLKHSPNRAGWGFSVIRVFKGNKYIDYSLSAEKKLNLKIPRKSKRRTFCQEEIDSFLRSGAESGPHYQEPMITRPTARLDPNFNILQNQSPKTQSENEEFIQSFDSSDDEIAISDAVAETEQFIPQVKNNENNISALSEEDFNKEFNQTINDEIAERGKSHSQNRISQEVIPESFPNLSHSDNTVNDRPFTINCSNNPAVEYQNILQRNKISNFQNNSINWNGMNNNGQARTLVADETIETDLQDMLFELDQREWERGGTKKRRKKSISNKSILYSFINNENYQPDYAPTMIDMIEEEMKLKELVLEKSFRENFGVFFRND
ncbi:hypothetical protein TRFO_25529 [Tritrichomonas foetus]|uniref:Uncharacterized protein n=1 Tax=Tritrichomonas foetus TaxID=1144522 RepID=A0A1J4K5Q0_9EUKA|nr:hypothetical protein TRFO_25529 [Tritrichomonas foetus]|eukprot:OHT06491.1 hypothetical protein TRFO_25529 [Tritrichomonas foetus]